MKNRLSIVLIICMVALVLLAPGCGAKPSPTAAPSPTATTASPSPSPAPTSKPTATPTPAPLITIRISHSASSPQDWKWKPPENLKKVLEEKFPGRVKVEIFPAGQLYSDINSLTAAQAGTIEMAFLAATFLTTWHPAFNIEQLPGVFPSRQAEEAWQKAADGGVARNKLLEPKGLKVLTVGWHGTNGFWSKKPLNKYEDLAGMKIRTTSVLQTDLGKLLGFSGTTISTSEVPSALQTGIVDGVYTTVLGPVVYGYLKITPHGLAGSLGAAGTAYVMNLPFWNRLPPDIQVAMTEAIAAFDPIRSEGLVKDEEAVFDQAKAAGGNARYLTATEASRYIELFAPVVQKYSADISPELMQSAKRVAQQYLK